MPRNEDRDRTRDRLGALAEAPDVDTDDAARTPTWLTAPDRRSGMDQWIPERFRGARVSPGRRGAAALAAVAVVVAIVAGVSVFRERPVAQAVPPLPVVQTGDASATSSAPAPTPAADLVVSVVGLVQRSGLVHLPPGARVADALAAAGGPKDGADVLSLNMAQRVADGDQILVGAASPDGGPPMLGSATVGAGSPAPSAPGATGAKVNLNSATEQELDALPGVGPVTAAAIIGWRSANGRFTDVEQLAEVDGIGPGRLAKLRELVVV